MVPIECQTRSVLNDGAGEGGDVGVDGPAVEITGDAAGVGIAPDPGDDGPTTAEHETTRTAAAMTDSVLRIVHPRNARCARFHHPQMVAQRPTACPSSASKVCGKGPHGQEASGLNGRRVDAVRAAPARAESVCQLDRRTRRATSLRIQRTARTRNLTGRPVARDEADARAGAPWGTTPTWT